MKIGYICDNCGEVNPIRAWVFFCKVCEKEICESCMYGFSTCKECSNGKTDAELRVWDDDEEEYKKEPSICVL